MDSRLPWPCLVGLKQDEQCGLIVSVEKLHIDNVQKFLIQFTNINEVTG